MVAAVASETRPYPALMSWLVSHAIPFEIREHPLSYTADLATNLDWRPAWARS